jgi:hypothetical protein
MSNANCGKSGSSGGTSLEYVDMDEKSSNHAQRLRTSRGGEAKKRPSRGGSMERSHVQSV